MDELALARVNAVLSELEMLKQWASLADGLIADLAKRSSQGWNAPQLTEDQVHNLRLMRTLIESLPGEQANFDILPQNHCLKCGHDFEIPSKLDLSDHKGAHIVDTCPQCRGRRPFGENDTILRDELTTLTA